MQGKGGWPLVAMVLLALVACQSASPTPVRSMKGWELYSWQEAGEWHFALMVGTNRLKSWEEIEAEGVETLPALGKKLGELAPREQIFWSAGPVPHTEHPPAEIIQGVRALCRALELELAILTD